MPEPTPRRRAVLRGVAGATAAALLAGCGVRIDTPGAGPEPLDEPAALRQRLAEQTDLLARSAARAAAVDSTAPTAGLLTAVATDADTQLDHLGGTWAPGGRHADGPVARSDVDGVLALLLAGAEAAREAALSGPADLVPLTAGIAVARALRADQLASALGGEAAVLGGGDGTTLPDALDPGSAVDLVRTLDALGWVAEIAAARADGDASAAQAAAADRWRDEALAVATSAGVAGTDDDPRAIAYDLDVADAAAVDATTATLLANLLPGWLAQVPTTAGTDRERVLALAHLAGRQAGLTAPDASPPAVAGLPDA